MGKYTKVFDECVSAIVTECQIYPPIDYTKEKFPAPISVKEAMWDTGADICVISQELADNLGLVPFDQIYVNGVHGEELQSLYHIHVKLPTNDIVVYAEAVIGAKNGYDLVLGMNVISQGDIAITTADDKTVFSIRIPSEGHIKF